jgi:hypothetical protein
MRPRAVVAFAACALLLLTLWACSSVGKLTGATPTGIDLTGTWRLDRAASDDPRKLMEKIKGQADRGRPASDDEMADSAVPGDGRQRGGTPGEERTSPGERKMRRGGGAEMMGEFLADVGPGRNVLRIEQSRTGLVIDNGVHQRKLTPGDSNVVSVAAGVADQRSGWDGNAYVIKTSGQNRPTIVERFSLSPDRLHLLVNVKIDGNGGMPSMDIKRVYDTASDSDATRAPST